MKYASFALILVTLGSGCTTVAMERYTFSQTATVTDLRYREVLRNMARLAANPGVLPSFAVVADGTAQVNDTVQFDAKTTWTHLLRGFSSEGLTPMRSRNPQPQWTLDPVADHDKLVTLQCAVLWVLYGPPPPCNDCMTWLKKFQVDGDLARLPPGWFHTGCCKDVPHDACYQAHCHGTYVWVTPDGMKGLSDFTLILLDIATVDLTAPLGPIHPEATVSVDLYPKKDNADNKTTLEEKVPACQAAKPDGSPGLITVTIPYTNQTFTIENVVAIPQVSAPLSGGSAVHRPEYRSTSTLELRNFPGNRWKQ